MEEIWNCFELGQEAPEAGGWRGGGSGGLVQSERRKRASMCSEQKRIRLIQCSSVHRQR